MTILDYVRALKATCWMIPLRERQKSRERRQRSQERAGEPVRRPEVERLTNYKEARGGF